MKEDNLIKNHDEISFEVDLVPSSLAVGKGGAEGSVPRAWCSSCPFCTDVQWFVELVGLPFSAQQSRNSLFC